MSPQSGPDFLCVGLAKAGTGWLYDQLRPHPDFWMPPIKEIRYLHLKQIDAGRAKRMLRKIRRASRKLEQAKKPLKAKLLRKVREATHKPPKIGTTPWFLAFDERDRGFLEEMSSQHRTEMSLERYNALFRFKGDLLTGDVSPMYSTMQKETILRAFAMFPDLKIVLLVRDPVARVWSHLSMYHRKGRLKSAAKLQDVDGFRKLLERKSIKFTIRRGKPASMAQRWMAKVPDGQLRHFFFDDIANNADETRREVLKFLGADPMKGSGKVSPDHNRKATLPKLEMPDDIKQVLVEHLAKELRASRDLFGGHAAEWAKKYGV